jgi:hypothetical protein
LAYPASLGRLVPAGARSNRRPRLCLHRFGLTQLGGLLRERKVCTAIFGVRVAPAHDEPGSGSNNSERESTSGRSTNCGSGDLIRVFRDIERIFSLLFLLRHPSPVGQPLRGRGSKAEDGIWFRRRQKTVSIVFRAELTRTSLQCVIRQNENPARAL